MWIILWIIASLFESIEDSFRKVAVDNSTLSKSLFAIIWPIAWFFILSPIFYINWISEKLFWDFKILFLILLISSIYAVSNFLFIYVYKNIKISELLPYSNMWKLFIVIIWFFLYYWTENETSIYTFLIAIFTVLIVSLFSIDFKKFSISSKILIYIFALLLEAIALLIAWYTLLFYTTIEYIFFMFIFTFSLYFCISIFKKESFKQFINQTKKFYKARITWVMFSRLSFILSLYIIETSGIVIAILISFISIVFAIFSMKIILKDTPKKKEIILAFLVTLLIWFWYYLN